MPRRSSAAAIDKQVYSHAYCNVAKCKAFVYSNPAGLFPTPCRHRSYRFLTVSCVLQSQHLATDIVQKLPAASVAALVASLSLAQPNMAAAAEFYQPPSQTQTQQVSKRGRPIKHHVPLRTQISGCLVVVQHCFRCFVPSIKPVAVPLVLQGHMGSKSDAQSDVLLMSLYVLTHKHRCAG